MLEMLAVVAPLFTLILVGFAAGFATRFRAASTHLNSFVFYFGLPAFIYTAMVTAPPIDRFPLVVPLIVVVVTAALAVVLYVLCRSLLKHPGRLAAPTSLAGSFGNVGYFGIPVSIGVIGPEAGLAAGVVHMIHNIMFLNGYPVVRTAVGAAADGQQTRGFAQLWRHRIWPIIRRSLLLNPMFLGIGMGLLVALTPVSMPDLIDEPVSILGATAVPVALFCVGLALHPALEGVRSGGVPLIPIAMGTAAKLLILPGLTWLAVLPFYDQLGPVWAGVVIILAATPSSTIVFLFSEEYDGDGRLAAAILVASTAGCLVTMPLIAEFMLM